MEKLLEEVSFDAEKHTLGLRSLSMPNMSIRDWIWLSQSEDLALRAVTTRYTVCSNPGSTAPTPAISRNLTGTPLQASAHYAVTNQIGRGLALGKLSRRMARCQAHWKLKPPRWPVTSTTSPIKNRPGTFLTSMVLDDSSRVSTPPSVTSAFL